MMTSSNSLVFLLTAVALLPHSYGLILGGKLKSLVNLTPISEENKIDVDSLEKSFFSDEILVAKQQPESTTVDTLKTATKLLKRYFNENDSGSTSDDSLKLSTTLDAIKIDGKVIKNTKREIDGIGKLGFIRKFADMDSTERDKQISSALAHMMNIVRIFGHVDSYVTQRLKSAVRKFSIMLDDDGKY